MAAHGESSVASRKTSGGDGRGTPRWNHHMTNLNQWIDPRRSVRGRFRFGEDLQHSRIDVKLCVRELLVPDKAAGSGKTPTCLMLEVGAPRQCRTCLSDGRSDLLISPRDLDIWRRIEHENVQPCAAFLAPETDYPRVDVYLLRYDYACSLSEIVGTRAFHSGTASSQGACVSILAQLRDALSYLDACGIPFWDLSSDAVYVLRREPHESTVEFRCQIRNQMQFVGCGARSSPGSGWKVKAAIDALSAKHGRKCWISEVRLIQSSANLLRLACLGMQMVLGTPADLSAQLSSTYSRVLASVSRAEYSVKFLDDLVALGVAEISISPGYSRQLEKFRYMIQSWTIEVAMLSKGHFSRAVPNLAVTRRRNSRC